jgi:hypothetical protein
MPTGLLICILTSELPPDGSLRGVASLLPSLDFGVQKLPTGDAPGYNSCTCCGVTLSIPGQCVSSFIA